MCRRRGHAQKREAPFPPALRGTKIPKGKLGARGGGRERGAGEALRSPPRKGRLSEVLLGLPTQAQVLCEPQASGRAPPSPHRPQPSVCLSPWAGTTVPHAGPERRLSRMAPTVHRLPGAGQALETRPHSEAYPCKWARKWQRGEATGRGTQSGLGFQTRPPVFRVYTLASVQPRAQPVPGPLMKPCPGGTHGLSSLEPKEPALGQPWGQRPISLPAPPTDPEPVWSLSCFERQAKVPHRGPLTPPPPQPPEPHRQGQTWIPLASLCPIMSQLCARNWNVLQAAWRVGLNQELVNRP